MGSWSATTRRCRIIEVSAGKPLSHIAIPSDEGIKIFDVRESEVEVTPVYRFDW
jgi:hypothetical protein